VTTSGRELILREHFANPHEDQLFLVRSDELHPAKTHASVTAAVIGEDDLIGGSDTLKPLGNSTNVPGGPFPMIGSMEIRSCSRKSDEGVAKSISRLSTSADDRGHPLTMSTEQSFTRSGTAASVGAPMNRLLLAVLTLSVAAGLAIGAQSGNPSATAVPHGYVPVSDEMLWKPDPANWLSWRRTLDGWGYSPLNQIDRSRPARTTRAPT
jgi:hypothetical protein